MSDIRGPNEDHDVDEQSSHEAPLLQNNQSLQRRVDHLERQLEVASELVQRVKNLKIWDFSPYEITPDSSWVAIDREEASELLRTISHIDHWAPWETTIEPRPQQ